LLSRGIRGVNKRYSDGDIGKNELRPGPTPIPYQANASLGLRTEFKISDSILLVAPDFKHVREGLRFSGREKLWREHLHIPYAPPEKKQSLMKPLLPFSVNIPMAVVSVDVDAKMRQFVKEVA
jgi:hypothetical protein